MTTSINNSSVALHCQGKGSAVNSPSGPALDRQDLIDRASALARENFAQRAAQYDESASFPEEDFDDLFRAGLNSVAVPREYGGHGLGPFGDDVLALWMITKVLAKADLSLARCWEGHVNSMVLLANIAGRDQKERWFEGVVQRGTRWVAWSGEPQARAPGEKMHFGTRVEKVAGGYVVDGTKVFATSAGGADWAIILVNTAGPGGARHATGSADGVLMLACDLSDPSVSFDASWWDPIGMRGTVSLLARFDRTFISEADAIGYPGQYLKEGWQTCFTPHYAASFLGAAESAFEFTTKYLTCQKKGGDPYVQQHIGQIAINVETAQLWLGYVASLWEARRYDEAKQTGIRARYLIDRLASDTVQRCIQACGARSLIRPNRLERIYRDLSFYVLHDNADQVLATIGKCTLGESHDASFFNK
jgi:alkylation response protein AidB-like acyl-CoA dehydrogenase